MSEPRIILAMDGFSDKTGLIMMMNNFRPFNEKIWGFKFNDAFDIFGPKVGLWAAERGFRVFVDQKFHDIPNTVKNRVKHYSDLNATFVNVHASGGTKMMEAAVEVTHGSRDMKVLAVTIPTSMTTREMGDIYQSPYREYLVPKFAHMAMSAGCDGVICAPGDLGRLSQVRGLKVTPNIRPAWYATPDDQNTSNSMTPKQAVDAGATHLVIGRPILHDCNPVDALEATLGELQ